MDNICDVYCAIGAQHVSCNYRECRGHDHDKGAHIFQPSCDAVFMIAVLAGQLHHLKPFLHAIMADRAWLSTSTSCRLITGCVAETL